jgi:GTP-binding protein
LKHPPVVFSGSAVRPDQFPSDGLPEVAFLGRSNVGKSSLLNALAGVQGLARVSATPGRTRLVNFFRVGDELYFADLPGYGYAKVSQAERRRFEILVRSYLEGRAPLALGVFLVDARHEPQPNDEILRGYLDTLGVPFVLAATKSDKLGRAELTRRVAALRAGLARGALDVVATSATSKAGIDELWSVIRAAARRRREA